MVSRTARAATLLLLFAMSPRSVSASRRFSAPLPAIRACGTTNDRDDRTFVSWSHAHANISDSPAASSRRSSRIP
jgi:hypothetical protein